MSGSDFADWWNDKVVKNEPSLTKWIRENPGLASIIFTPAVPGMISSVDSFIEVARIGEGFGAAASDEATALDMVKGVGSDLMRGLTVIPFFRAPGMAIKVGLQQVAVRAPLFKGLQGGICAEIAGVQAARRSGQKLFLKLDDLLRLTGGKGLKDLTKGTDFIDLSIALKRLGIPHTGIHPPFSSFDDMAKAISGSEVIIFGVRWTRKVGGKVVQEEHALHAFRDHAGRFRIGDREGPVASSLQELGKLIPAYEGIENAVIHPTGLMLKIKGLQILEIIDKVGFGVLMVPLMPRVVVNADQTTPEMVTQSVEAKIERDERKKIPPTVPAAPVKASTAKPLKPAVPRADWLTGVKFRLNHLGYGAGPPVHVFDERCKAAIRQFQKDYNLQVDGIPGPQTQAKLKAVCKY
jgi:hypothetical protein